MTGWPILSLVVFTPLIGVALILFVPKDNHRLIRGLALMAALASLVFSLRLLGYEPSGAEFQYREDISWIAAFGMRYTLGVDGLSVVLVLLTTVLSVVSIFYSFDPIQNRVKEYYATMLLLMVGMLGVFVSLDLFLFFVFSGFLCRLGIVLSMLRKTADAAHTNTMATTMRGTWLSRRTVSVLVLLKIGRRKQTDLRATQTATASGKKELQR